MTHDQHEDALLDAPHRLQHGGRAMNDHDTTRERLAKICFGDEWPFDLSDQAYGTKTAAGFRESAEKTANDVIAHLWARADDPEVVGDVARNLLIERLTPSELNRALQSRSLDITDDHIRQSKEAIATLLEALLGPRPTGGNR